MKSHALIVAVLAFAFIYVSAGYARQSAEQLYQSALYKEEIKGELNDAIKIYEKIIEDYPENRPVAAKALLHIGLCNEKLGKQEAQKAYQRLIEEYPGQKQEVAIAKERLAVLSKELEEVSHKPTFRNIRIPTKPGNGALSPDGKKLAFVSKGSIWVVPVHGKVSPDIAGEPVRLPGTEGAWSWGMRWSADGKWIAYNTLPSEDHVGICIVPSSGGKVKRIVNRYRAGGNLYNYLLSLSPDGKIVAFTSNEKGKSQLFTVNVDGGDVNQLTEDGGTQPAFSPDGKKIAYVKEKPQKTEIRKSDVWVIPAAGGTPVQVSDLPGEATGPLWSPDGKMIAFSREADPGSDSSKEICIVPVSETGKPEASPTQIELPLITRNHLAGWTPDNKIGVLLKNPVHYAIYTVPASGGNATQVTPQGYYFSPRWSPDGKRIYLRWTDGPDGIASVPSEGGEFSISPIDADSMTTQPLQWGGNVVSPDGKKIVFPASKKGSSYIYTIPVEGGEPEQLTIIPGWDRFPCWSPDGKSIAFIRYSDDSFNYIKRYYIMNIFIVRPEGGEVRQLTSKSDKVKWATISWSPDGKSIAYYSEDKTIRIIPVQGGESREVVKVERVNEWGEMGWSRDGKKIAYSSKGRIWVVSLDGGEPEEIKTGLDAKASHISWSPDGENIAFTAMLGGDTELCLMENFLPEVKEYKAFNIRKVWADPDADILGAPSPDGKYLSYTDWETGDLAIREIATGKKRRLTNKGSWDESDEFAEYSRWSPDGKQIVYDWCNENNFIELRIIGLDGSKPRILYSNEEVVWAYTYDWSLDGRQILACFVRKDGPGQMVLVSTADGSVRVLKILEQGWPENISFSPDGRYIVYDFPTKEDSPDHDIYLMSTDGSREIPLVEHPANEFVLGWAPDGKNILFASDRTGTFDAWVIQVTDGKPHGTPELIKKGIGKILPMGFTQKSSFYYGISHNNMNVYIAKLDPETGKILIPPKKAIKRFEGFNTDPNYSPDGKYLGYLSQRGPTYGPTYSGSYKVLCIRNLETDDEREFPSNIITPYRILKLHWSPDCRSILVRGIDNKKDRCGIFRIDVQTGDVTTIVLSDEDELVFFGSCGWSRDGKAIFYVRTDPKADIYQILVRDLESGTEKELYRADGRFYLSCSPDGKCLAFINRGNKGVLRIMPAAGGEPRELYRLEKEEGFGPSTTWSADGKYILFTKQPLKQNYPKRELCRISAEGGEPEKLGLEMIGINNLSVHPGGRHIAFHSLGFNPKFREVWVMENFLPE